VSGVSPYPPPDLALLRPRRPPPPLPIDLFGPVWGGWMTSTAAAAAAPRDYVAAALLAVASSLIGHARWVSVTPGWNEPPHLWVGQVGNSGDGKSPANDSLLGYVLPELERRALRDFPDRHAEWRVAAARAKAEKEKFDQDMRSAVKTGASTIVGSWKAPEEAPPEPQAPRLKLSDVTVERIATLLAAAAPKGMLVGRDELAGFLLGLDRYHEGDRAFWLECYGGRPYRVERQGRPEPVIIPHLAVSLLGGIQPGRLAEVAEGADDGLLARFMWFWPDPVPFDLGRRPPETAAAVRRLDRLRQLELLPADDDHAPRPLYMPVEEDALADLVDLARYAQERQREAGPGLLTSALGKARGLAARVACVLTLLGWCAEEGTDPPPRVISRGAVQRAIRFVQDYAIPMAARVFGDAALSKTELHAARLARWIAATRPEDVHVRTMQRDIRLPGLDRGPLIHAACVELVGAGWLTEPLRVGRGQGRKPERYGINPLLYPALDAMAAGRGDDEGV
jgi:Protein of unknown function (DUF3987)